MEEKRLTRLLVSILVGMIFLLQAHASAIGKIEKTGRDPSNEEKRSEIGIIWRSHTNSLFVKERQEVNNLVTIFSRTKILPEVKLELWSKPKIKMPNFPKRWRDIADVHITLKVTPTDVIGDIEISTFTGDGKQAIVVGRGAALLMHLDVVISLENIPKIAENYQEAKMGIEIKPILVPLISSFNGSVTNLTRDENGSIRDACVEIWGKVIADFAPLKANSTKRINVVVSITLINEKTGVDFRKTVERDLLVKTEPSGKSLFSHLLMTKSRKKDESVYPARAIIHRNWMKRPFITRFLGKWSEERILRRFK